MNNKPQLNIIFLGNFPYPYGMAGTKRVQHAIDGVRHCDPSALSRVIVLRQAGDANAIKGSHKGVPYETVGANLFRAKAMMMAPFLNLKAKRIILQSFQPAMTNVLYVYGPPTLDNRNVVRNARNFGFKVIFDIVEDDDVAFSLSKSIWHRLKNVYTRYATANITELADGIIVISSRLKGKFARLTKGMIPLHTRPVSVDFSCSEQTGSSLNQSIRLLYSGSFGPKDGVGLLLDAFDRVANHTANIHMVLTGRGSVENMRPVLSRIDASPHRARIIYKGYLGDDEYYATLMRADIPCMTRIDLPYAHAGFPFKLGEYLASGKPVIASKVSDVESILKDRHSAMLVPPGDSGAIAGAIEYLIGNPEQAKNIGIHGREVAQLHFDYRIQGARLLEFFRNLEHEGNAGRKFLGTSSNI